MHVKRRRLPNFESCSVALFTSLVLGGAAIPARSQSLSTPSSRSAPATSPARTSSPHPTASAWQLSHEDRIARLQRWFDRVDGNKDGSISSADFDEALK